MAELRHRLPIGELGPMAHLAVQIDVLPVVGMITLRGDLSRPGLQDAVREVTGCEVPVRMQYSEQAEHRVYWMSPDELLLQIPTDRVAAGVDALQSNEVDDFRLAVDVSDARVRFQLRGDGAGDVLAKGTPMALHRSVFTPGMFRRTRLGALAVAICHTAGQPETYEVFCFRSYANYLLAWLQNAAQEGTLPD